MRYHDEQDAEAMADYLAEMRQQDAEDRTDRRGTRGTRRTRSWSDMSYAEKCRGEGFPDFEAGVQNAGCYD